MLALVLVVSVETIPKENQIHFIRTLVCRAKIRCISKEVAATTTQCLNKTATKGKIFYTREQIIQEATREEHPATKPKITIQVEATGLLEQKLQILIEMEIWIKLLEHKITMRAEVTPLALSNQITTMIKLTRQTLVRKITMQVEAILPHLLDQIRTIRAETTEV